MAFAFSLPSQQELRFFPGASPARASSARACDPAGRASRVDGRWKTDQNDFPSSLTRCHRLNLCNTRYTSRDCILAPCTDSPPFNHAPFLPPSLPRSLSSILFKGGFDHRSHARRQCLTARLRAPSAAAVCTRFCTPPPPPTPPAPPLVYFYHREVSLRL